MAFSCTSYGLVISPPSAQCLDATNSVFLHRVPVYAQNFVLRLDVRFFLTAIHIRISISIYLFVDGNTSHLSTAPLQLTHPCALRQDSLSELNLCSHSAGLDSNKEQVFQVRNDNFNIIMPIFRELTIAWSLVHLERKDMVAYGAIL